MNNLHFTIIDGNHFHALGIKQVLQSLEIGKQARIDVYNSATEYLKAAVNPDIILMALMLPDSGGIKLCNQILQDTTSAKVLLMSMTDDDEEMLNCLTSRARGYLMRNFGDAELEFAISKVLNGDYYIDSNAAIRLIRASQNQRNEENGTLNEFEMTLLQYISDQMTDMDIVEKLRMPRGKLSYYKRKLYRKLDVRNSAGLIKKAVSLKLVS